MPRLRELNARVEATAARPSDSLHTPRDPGYVPEVESLPRCCQAWIAEQTHSWVGRH